MKKYALVGLFILLVLSLAVTVNADRQNWRGGEGAYNYCPNCGAPLGPQAGYGYHMGPGMMGPGWGYGMGPGMMGQGRGYGMGPGMMGQGRGYGYGQSEQCQKFFNETADLRKELYIKRFNFSEVIRDPKAKPETIGKLEKEMNDLQEKIYKKAPPGCFY